MTTEICTRTEVDPRRRQPADWQPREEDLLAVIDGK